MKYDFDSVYSRGKTSLKWDVKDGELPMWIADMDFKTAPEVVAAVQKRAEIGIYGYEIIPDEWYNSIINWWKRRHNFTIEKQWLMFTIGIVPTISCVVKRITNIGDNVLVLSPVYNIFFNSIENAGRHALESRLVYDNGDYSIDFDDLEEKLKNPLTNLFILCNPHNPVGKIWTREELEKIGELCEKYSVKIISDEIHADITEPNKRYVPFLSVNRNVDNTIVCLAASKAFNFAGLQSAAVCVSNAHLRSIVNRGINSDEIAEPNFFAVDASIAAFNEGEQWLDEMNEYVVANKRFAKQILNEQLPEIIFAKQDCTYLLWLDISAICNDCERLCEFIREKTGLYLSNGRQFRGDGKHFIRWNVAYPKSVMQDGLERFVKGVKLYKAAKAK